MAHGNQDEVISMETALASLEALKAERYHVSWHEFTMGHSVSIDEIDEIRTFLLKIIA
jgi:phospholipase/carboxylesterase